MWKATGTAIKTISVAPAVVGDLLVGLFYYATTTVSITAVSGGGCNASGGGGDGAWQRVSGPLTNSSGGYRLELWMGKVITTGAATITMTVASNSGTSRMNVKEFGTGGGLGTTWSLDGAGATKTNASSTTVAFSTLTPTGLNRLYVGGGSVAGSATLGSQTAGYSLETDSGNNPFLYNASVAQSAQSPTCLQSPAGTSDNVNVLVKADNPLGSFMPFFM